MSNSVQLKHVLKQGHSHPFYGTQVALGIISVLMCASIGKFLVYALFFSFHRVLYTWSSFFILRLIKLFVVVITTFPCRFLGLAQSYTFLFTRLDHLPSLLLSSSTIPSLTRNDQLFIILPVALTILLLLFNIIFLIIMFTF